MDRQVVVTTARLVVTTWLPSDVDDLHAVHSDPVTMRFVGPGRPETRDECERRLTSYLGQQHDRGWTKWRVQTTDGTMIGRAGFGAFGPHRELGYTLRREAWGRGLATEVARALVGWHAQHPEPSRPSELWAYAALENVASQRVLEKVGFDFVDHRDHHDQPCAFYVRVDPD